MSNLLLGTDTREALKESIRVHEFESDIDSCMVPEEAEIPFVDSEASVELLSTKPETIISIRDKSRMDSDDMVPDELEKPSVDIGASVELISTKSV